VEVIREQATLKHPNETGGILVGYYSSTLRTATAVLATPPPSDSKHGPTNFERGTNGLKQLLAACKKQTPPLHYLGEWHTHPAYNARASSTDIRQMDCFSFRRLYGAKSPLLLVVGGIPPDNLEWRASVHRMWRKPAYLELL
jgi:integrative and conjugative element protein (TIGR02256 family)